MEWLKNNSKNIGAALIVIVLLGGWAANHFGLYDKLQSTSVNVKSTDNITESTPSLSVNSKSAPSNFTVEMPEVPSDGREYGVVEVGASGFNSFVILRDNARHYKVTSKVFGDSLALEGLTSTDEVKAQLKKYLAQMLNKGVQPNRLHFVISSGALKEPKTVQIANDIRKAGFVVNEITAEQEGKLAFKAAMNPKYSDNSFVVDIGSGNTKVSWVEGSSIKTIEASGAKYFQNGISDDSVREELTRVASKVPESKRKNCFIIGGSPNTVAKKYAVAKNGRYFLLGNLDSINPGDDKKLRSGLVIMKAIKEATNTTFIFDDDANFTVGFLLDLK